MENEYHGPLLNGRTSCLHMNVSFVRQLVASDLMAQAARDEAPRRRCTIRSGPSHQHVEWRNPCQRLNLECCVRASEAGARGELGLRICESPLKMMMCLAYFRGPSAPQRTFPIPHGFPKILSKGRDSLCCCGNSSELFRLCKAVLIYGNGSSRA